MSDMPGAPDIRGADHVGFAVSSLDATIRFFVEGLGATLVRQSEAGGDFVTEVTGARGAGLRLAVVELAGFSIELLEYANAPPAAASPPPFAPGMAHLALSVGDLDDVLRRIAPYGWRAQGAPQTIAAGRRAGTRVMYVVGPDGATIELMQPPRAT